MARGARKRTPLLLLGVGCALACSAALPRTAAACSMCETGDPTLTVMGAQQPFDQRLRLALELQYRTDALGQPHVNQVKLNEERLALSVAYAPVSWLMLSASLPLLRRELTYVDLSKDMLITPGDTELRARAFVWRDRDFAPHHLLGLIAGLRIPTGPIERDSNGAYRAPELQAGSGSFDPLAGVSYAFFADPWSVYASEVVYIPTQGTADYRVGTSWRGTHTLQYQLGHHFALRAGAEFRLEARSKNAQGYEPDTGGFILFGVPSLVWSPLTDLVFNLDLHIPVVNALYGYHDEGLFAMLGAAYDL